MTLELISIEKVKDGDYSDEYEAYFKFSFTPNIRYFMPITITKVLKDEETYYEARTLIEKILKNIDLDFRLLNVFKVRNGIQVPIYVSWAGGNVKDEPKHHIWENDIAYITIEAKAGTTNGWIAAILKFKINEEILTNMIIKRVVNLWDKYVEKVMVESFDILFLYPLKFRVPYETKKMKVESCWIGCGEEEIEVRIPKGLLEDVDKVVKTIPIDKLKRIIEKSIRELEKIEEEAKSKNLNFIEEIVRIKKEKRISLLKKIYEDQLEIT